MPEYKCEAQPGPASSEEERSLRKIIYSGDLSLNQAKMMPRVFHAQINFALSVSLILQKMSLDF